MENDMGNTRDRTYVWDPLIRVFHWALVGAFTVAYLSAEEDEQVHVAAGYVIGGLLVVRILWGLFGPHHARFSDFVFSPTVILRDLRDLVAGRSKRYLGHSPAGGAMVVALLISLSVTCLTGIAMAPNGDDGPELFEELHEVAAALTLALVVAHIAGVLLTSILHRENLPLAMITGRKRPLVDNQVSTAAPDRRSVSG
jgi:cytochrome b